MDADEESTQESERESARLMREVWSRREKRPDLTDPVVLVFEADDGLGGELAELIQYPDDEGMVITLISAEVIARSLEGDFPDVSGAIRAANRSRPLAVFASLRYWFLLVYLDESLGTN